MHMQSEKRGLSARALQLAPYGALLLAYLVVRPWGDFPLNDDWVYARIAHRLADTGRLLVVGCTSSVIGQVLLAAPLVKLFGHSHLVLRALTMALGLISLWALGRLLRVGDVRPRLACATLLVMALNPLFFYSATTFMNELYGLLPALLGAVLFFEGRQKAEARSPEGPVLPVWRMAVVGVLVGATFWTRQLCAVVFPALVGATLLALVMRRDWARLRRSLLPLGVGCAVFLAVVLLYFPVARASGNLPTAFSQSLYGTVTEVSLKGFTVGPVIFVTYMTAFFLPLLLLFPWAAPDLRRLAAVAGAGVLLVVLGVVALQWVGTSSADAAATAHSTFPFGGNVLLDSGIGPVTVSDVYQLKLAHPQWPAWVWTIIGAIVVAGTAAWAPVLLGGWRARAQAQARPLQWEMILFAGLLAVVSLLVPLQVFKLNVFERYYLPSMMGIAVLLPVVFSLSTGPSQAVSARARWGFAVALAALAYYSVAGVHDEFRWNEARWSLVEKARSQGVAPQNIDGGYEVNGWFMGEDTDLRTPAAGSCIGPCHCFSGWWCPDGSYHIGMNALAGYETVSTLPPAYWLAAGPPMILERRLPSTLLMTWRGERPGASLHLPPGAARHAQFRLLAQAAAETRPLYECAGGQVTLQASCADGSPAELAGHLLSGPGRGARALYQCRRQVGDALSFVSADPSCEGQQTLALRGFAPP
ncbi:MAG: hypothetical protein HY901_04345 [Deltaproteobacteria bacterium]|nr:hypothetical protein [Deltaproteobacteria bacterium]